MRMRLAAPLLALLAACGTTRSAFAVDLTMGVSRGPSAIDPHFYSGTADKNVSAQIFDRLIDISVDVKPIPGLALSWTPVSETVWEFKLRPGVKWHDGVDFTADDVLFTLSRAGNVPKSPGGFGVSLRSIAKVEAEGPLLLRITTTEAAPNLPLDLSNIAIVSRHAGQGAATEDYNSGKAAIGTGPYKFVSFAFEDRVELVRNDAWWGLKQDWERVHIRVIPQTGSRMAALLSGDVDMIDQPTPDDITRLRSDPKVHIESVPGTRTFYLSPDIGRTDGTPDVTDNAGQKMARNPLADLMVRQALQLAINQPGLSDRVLQGTGVPTGQWMWPGAYSYDAAIPLPAYDPARARALLAQAGYKEGFHLVLHVADDGSNSKIAQAVAQMWVRIGITTEVSVLPAAVYYSRTNKHEFSMTVSSWGSNSGEAGFLLRNVVGSPARGWGLFNSGSYTNPALDALTAKALSTFDANAREALLVQAVGMAMHDLPIIPLYQAKNVWAVRNGISYQARPDQRTIAMAAHLLVGSAK